jgi:hypothetical protein
MGKGNPLIAFRISKRELEFLEDKMKSLKLSKTEIIRYALHKTFINSKIQAKEFRERLF